MKLLISGDWHGYLPQYLRKIIRKEKPDALISVGDLCNFLERKLFFKYVYGTGIPLETFIGKERAKDYTKRNFESGKRVLKYLNNLDLPVFIVTGNHDPSKWPQIGHTRSKNDPYDKNIFEKMNLKNIYYIDFKAAKFGEYIIIGYPRSSYPGWTGRAKYSKKALKSIERSKENIMKRKKDFYKYKKMLEKLFKKHKKENIIFLSHNVPYNTKLDVISDKKSHKLARGEHYGDNVTRTIIKEFQPMLCIGGHIHEHKGKDKIGKTIIVNSGGGYKKDKGAAIITLDQNKIKKIKFY